jgi:hypothetical protein|tara:strand:- start:54 stop:1013 length:960 start_codon:yes stop_codon:yes gene_type:complete
MTYSAGSTIVDDDYNIFATGNAAGTGDAAVANINTILGVGDDERGYGQSGALGSVTVGETVQATSWASLLTKNTLLANHQGTTITSITNPTSGNTISAYAALSANVTATFNGKLDAAGSGSDSTVSSVTTTSWNTSSTLSKTFTFASRNQLRYFFNTGGMIRLSWSRTGGTTSSQNTAWTDTLTAAGTIVLTSDGASKTIAGVAYTGTTKIGGSGTNQILLTANGIYDIASTPAIYFKQIPPSGYGDNEIEVSMSIPADGTVLTILTDLSDDYTPPDPGSPDLVDGTLTQVTTIRYPSTTYLADTWGTVTQNSPTWVQS